MPSVGYSIPPPEVQAIVDKTASYVAKNGIQLEHLIQQREGNNPKFSFLNPGDAYHAYYQHKLEEYKEGS